jgi:hypothetical protein
MDAEASSQIMEPFFLLGLLANYNKFEFQNPYRLRLDDFVNETTIKKIVYCIGSTCASARDKYIAIQDDLPEGWNLGSTLSYIGLGALAQGSRPATPTPSTDEAKNLFLALPGPETGILLAAYDFTNANKLFCFNLVTLPPDNKGEASPLASFLSLTSYMFQHAHRTPRSSTYPLLSLFILQILIEDQALAKRMCSDESKIMVRLCRQRQPFLPLTKGERPAASTILDIMMDGINHNLRRRLDVQFYMLCLGVVLRIVSFLGRSRLKFSYHWSELWRSLLSFTRFLTTYASDIKSLPNYNKVIDALVDLIAFSLSAGEAFLPDAQSYDDLFYKLVETGDILNTFRTTYNLQKSPEMELLVGVSTHYNQLLTEKMSKGGRGNKSLSPKEVQGIIKQGYDTLNVSAREGLDQFERWREADWRVGLKRCARVVVDDGKVLVGEGP